MGVYDLIATEFYQLTYIKFQLLHVFQHSEECVCGCMSYVCSLKKYHLATAFCTDGKESKLSW